MEARNRAEKISNTVTTKVADTISRFRVGTGDVLSPASLSNLKSSLFLNRLLASLMTCCKTKKTAQFSRQ